MLEIIRTIGQVLGYVTTIAAFVLMVLQTYKSKYEPVIEQRQVWRNQVNYAESEVVL